MNARSSTTLPSAGGRIHASSVELGCGQHKREGFFGIDIQGGPGVDLVLDIEREPLPFEDDTVERIYSSHMFEHLCAPGSPIQTLREIVRVCKHNAEVEIWTPYGKSNDGLLLGHHNFYTETHWQHICCFYADTVYLGPAPGRFIWHKTQYVLDGGILEHLDRLGFPLSFAVDHLYNIVREFGVFLRVDKTLKKAPNPQTPIREFGYQRGTILTTLNGVLEPRQPEPTGNSTPPPPLRYRAVDLLNAKLKERAPALHSIARNLIDRLPALKRIP